MNAIFFHDHIITKKNNKLYSTGGLNKVVMNRYNAVFSDISLATRQNNYREIEKLSVIGTTNEINFVVVPNLATIKLTNFYKAYKIISSEIKKHDFIIIRLPSIIGFIASYIAMKKNKKHVVELVGCPYDAFGNYSLKGKIVAFPFYLITKFFVKKADNVLYVTENFLQTRYPSNAKNQISCSDVELVIDKNVFNDRMKTKYSYDGKICKIGMIGSLNAKYKGYDTAIKALKLINEKTKNKISLQLVGGGDNRYILDLCDKYDCTNFVSFIGTLSYPDGIFEWLDSIDIYLQPSRVEGLPRSLIEAMSRGCACFGSDVGGIPELLSANSVHKKDDFKELYELIIKVVSDAAEFKNNIALCFEKAREFDRKKLNAKRHSFYKKCLLN